MGQAKRRGSREQRITQRQEAAQMSIDQVKRDLEIPTEAEFVGYAVHLEDKDEFLASLEVDRDAIKRLWSKRPQDAYRFTRFEDCYATHRKCPSSVIVALFETETQFFTAIDQNTRSR